MRVKMQDGRVVDTVQDAVSQFKCPGPCLAGSCPLYPIKPIHDDISAHMCHQDYVSAHAAEVALAIGCELTD